MERSWKSGAGSQGCSVYRRGFALRAGAARCRYGKDGADTRSRDSPSRDRDAPPCDSDRGRARPLAPDFRLLDPAVSRFHHRPLRGRDGQLRRHLRTRLSQIDVDLAANAEPPREVDARLDRESHAGDQRPLVRRLEVVEVRTRAVQIAIDRVAGAMDEKVAVTGGANHATRGVIEVGASDGLLLLPAISQQRDRSVP